MRHESAPAEQKLWRCLRDRQLNGLKFRRQHPLDGFIADFFCHEVGLVIEIDGDSHSHRETYDATRTKTLNRGGHVVIRFMNEDVHDFLDVVLEEILLQCEQLAKSTPPHPNPLPEGEGTNLPPLPTGEGRGEGALSVGVPADAQQHHISPHPDPLPGGEGTRRVIRVHDGKGEIIDDDLAIEEPLEIRVRGRAVSVTMRTPGNDDELAAGFLVTEGLIKSVKDVVRIEPCERNEAGNLVNVVLAPQVAVDFEKLTRHVFASSSCGLCGKATIDAVHGNFPPVKSDVKVDAEVLLGLPRTMREAQATFARTGGLHAAGIFTAAGELVVLREDVGRHNAVDKVVGYALLKELLPLDKHVLLVSGRASFEILQKALAARIAIVAAVSAPSTLAVDFASDSGMTLVGFLREGRMNIYTHGERVRFS